MSVIFLNLSTITVSLAFAFTFSWKLTLILLIFSPLMAAKGAIQSSVMKRMSKKSDEIEKNLGSFISDTISNIKTVKSFGGYN
jgi:ABC-type bacteriocin/lantibiotic exporter with double-glycine peptidase domain